MNQALLLKALLVQYTAWSHHVNRQDEINDPMKMITVDAIARNSQDHGRDHGSCHCAEPRTPV